MDMLRRIETYLRQNGSESRLTARQERRLRKKAHRDAKASRGTSLNVSDATKPCETCGVSEGRCITKTGKTARANHKARV